MKLLIVSHSCVEAPINQQFYAEVERQTGWDMTILTPDRWQDEYGNQSIPQRWPQYQGQLVSLPIWNSGSVPLHGYLSTCTQLFKELQPDFIYVHQEPYAITTSQLYFANRLTCRSPIGFFTWQNIYKQYPFPFNWLEQRVLQTSRIAFCGSRSAEVVLRQKGFQAETLYLPAGIDPTLHVYRPEAEELRNKLQAKPTEFLLGYVGRLVEQKGLKTLLHALKQIESLPWRLIVIGSGPDADEFDAIAQTLQLSPRINRLGFVESKTVPLYLSALHGLVLPSETRLNWKEQFGRVIIEAMACGTPVIGSDSGEIPHLLQATGGGLVFPEGQPQALAEQLQRLMLQPALRSQLAQQGQQSVFNHYTSPMIAQQFAQAIETVVQSSNSVPSLEQVV
jgi:glycosyltransferase involved in cell wall biosynthesis